jgi:hypothetical protein
MDDPLDPPDQLGRQESPGETIKGLVIFFFGLVVIFSSVIAGIALWGPLGKATVLGVLSFAIILWIMLRRRPAQPPDSPGKKACPSRSFFWFHTVFCFVLANVELLFAFQLIRFVGFAASNPWLAPSISELRVVVMVGAVLLALSAAFFVLQAISALKHLCTPAEES